MEAERFAAFTAAGGRELSYAEVDWDTDCNRSEETPRSPADEV